MKSVHKHLCGIIPAILYSSIINALKKAELTLIVVIIHDEHSRKYTMYKLQCLVAIKQIS